MSAIVDFVGFAHLARDKDLVKKRMDMATQFAEAIQRQYEGFDL